MNKTPPGRLVVTSGCLRGPCNSGDVWPVSQTSRSTFLCLLGQSAFCWASATPLGSRIGNREGQEDIVNKDHVPPWSLKIISWRHHLVGIQCRLSVSPVYFHLILDMQTYLSLDSQLYFLTNFALYEGGDTTCVEVQTPAEPLGVWIKPYLCVISCANNRKRWRGSRIIVFMKFDHRIFFSIFFSL